MPKTSNTVTKNPRPVSGGGKNGSKNTAYTMQRSLSARKVHQFSLISNFDRIGYRNREDITILPPGVLVLGSYNVLTNVGGRIGVTKGYSLDGQANATITPITSSFDFTKLLSNDTHVRTYGSNMQVRWVNPTTSAVTWITFYTNINSSNNINYASFWDKTSVKTEMLFVNGSNVLFKWSGAVAGFASATTNTLTKQGTQTWAQAGFNIPAAYTQTLVFATDANGGGTITDASAGFLTAGFALGESIVVSGTMSNNGTFTIIDIDAGTIRVGRDQTIVNESVPTTLTFTPSIVINGTTYTYTGGTGTTTLTGVSPNPSTPGYAVGTGIVQTVQAINNSSTNGLSGSFTNDLIANLDNQLFVGSKTSSVIYTSHVNNFLDYSYDSPRLVGQGAMVTIADYPRAFVNQEDNLYVSAGKDLWYRSLLNQTTTSVPDGSGGAVSTVYETLTYQQLKTTALQGAQSQTATTKIKNDIVFLSFEPIINSLGRVEDILLTPQVTDMSYPIVNDMNQYDFTDASMIYFRQFLYVSIPKEGLIRIYNMSNQGTDENGANYFYWEAPVTFPIARFSIINDELYGHGYAVPETYKLFDGYTFNTHPIPARAAFSYNNYGTRTQLKVFNLFYLEGYITSNCTLTYGFNYDIDGCQTQRTWELDGADRQLVCISLDDASLGKDSLGKRPLGGLIPNPYSTGLPPKFRAIKQVSEFPFYEGQIFFESLGKSQQWELVAAGPSAKPASEGNNSRQY